MKSALALTVRSVSRRILASSIASLLLAGMAPSADMDWSGTQTLTLGVAPGGDDVSLLADTVVTLTGTGGTLLENVIFNAHPGAATAIQHGNADISRHSSV